MGKPVRNSHSIINTTQRFFIKRPTFGNAGFGFKTSFPNEINLSQGQYYGRAVLYLIKISLNFAAEKPEH